MERRKHRRSVGALIVLACACSASPPSSGGPGSEGLGYVEQGLAAYHRMGFLTGSAEFPVVARVLAFRGPADSAWLALAGSMPPAALRFSREDGLFSGSYQVLSTAVADGDTVARLNRREIVRVEAFAETASEEELIFFQRFVAVPPGGYEIELVFRELTSRHEASRTFRVTVPRADDPRRERMSAPVVALRAVPRQVYRQPPPLIVAPRSTAVASREPPYLVVETYDPAIDTLTLSVSQDGERIWAQSLVAEPPGGTEPGPFTAFTTLPVARIPPGLATLTVTAGDGSETTSPLLVALDDVWAFADWRRTVEHLVYALPSDSVESWIQVPVRERARLWTAFWEATDLDPRTPRNEFLARYFDRMTLAERRYEEPGEGGWRSDRGRAYVQLGEPDTERVAGGRETGGPRRIEWTYEKSLPFPVRLQFVDQNDFGVYRMPPRSRAVLGDAAVRLRSLERSGAWRDPRDDEREDDDETTR